MNELRIRLELRKAALWKLLAQFVLLRDAHGVHDMAVEIQGIELMLREITAIGAHDA